MFLSPAPSPIAARGANSAEVWRRWLVCVGLVVAVVAAYAGVAHCGFVDYDDPGYVFENPSVQHGLNGQSIVWAFTTGWASNWHPLTWISHIVDFSLFGLDPAGYHVENVFWHAANSVLLFLWLESMTGAFWRSAVVAGFFALHPAHVESVAWVSERKDLLSTFFWIVTAWLYTGYVRQGGASPKRSVLYGASLAAFVAALLCKPMVVTLPCVLLLLDYWPLRRAEPWPGLVREKVPFFVLAAIHSVITVCVQHAGGAMADTTKFPLLSRFENAPIAYARYLGKLFWPAGLTMYYRHLKTWPVLSVFGACLLLLVLTALAVSLRRQRRYVLVGWLWFLGMIFPTIGLLQVGAASMADRYTYLSAVGIFIAVVWGIYEGVQFYGHRLIEDGVVFLTGLALLACGFATAQQVTYWRDTGTLFRHASSVGGGSYFTYYNLSTWLIRLKKYSQAEECLHSSIRDNPDYPYAYNNLASLQMLDGRYDQALTNAQKAVLLNPNYREGYINVARAEAALGRPEAAITNFQSALGLQPDDPETHYRLGSLFLQKGALDQALAELRTSIEGNATNVPYRLKLASAEIADGKTAQAITNYEVALKLDPNLPEACNNLAWIMAASPNAAQRDGQLAVALARHAVQLSGGQSPVLLGTLGAAEAEAGRFEEAVQAATQARRLALAQTNSPLAANLERQIVLYTSRQPFRDAAIRDNR